MYEWAIPLTTPDSPRPEPDSSPRAAIVSPVSDETGSALIFAIVISLVITSILLIIIGATVHQRRFVQRKADFLQARYDAESAIHKTLAQLSTDTSEPTWQVAGEYALPLSENDSAVVTRHPWGGYLYLAATARRKNRDYHLGTLVGRRPGSVFDYGVVINPRYYALVVTGDTRLYGDVLVGPSGVKKESLGGRPYTGERLVYGAIHKSEEDRRPEVDLAYVDYNYDGFQRLLDAPTEGDLRDLLTSDADTTVDLSAFGLERPIHVTSEDLNRHPWRIRGPGTLVADGPLRLDGNVQLENRIQVLSRHPIAISETGRFDNVLFYSPEHITLAGSELFRGQLFSESHISLRPGAQLSEPSLAMVYCRADTGGIRLARGSVVEGTVVLLTRERSPIPTGQRGTIELQPGSTVRGLVYSDNLVVLQGRVEGTVMTERFFFYRSPTGYYNWICNGQVDRNALHDGILVPYFFKQSQARFATKVIE